MPRLKDVLDALVSDFYAARAASDMRAAELHQLYSENEMLSQFAIPSFSFGQVHLDIPITLTGIEKSAPSEETGGSGTDPDEVIKLSAARLSQLAKDELNIRLQQGELAEFYEKARFDVEAYALEKGDSKALAETLTKLMQALINERKTKYDAARFKGWSVALHKDLEAKFGASVQPSDKSTMAYLGARVSLNSNETSQPTENNGLTTNLRLTLVEDSFRVEKIPAHEAGKFKDVIVRN